MVHRTARIATRKLGPFSYRERLGKGTPILLLHGAGFSSAVFENQLESPDLAGKWLIALDLPGHGQTEPASHWGEDYSFNGLARCVLDFLSILNLPPVVVVGWSLGGHVGYEMLDRPDRVSGLISIAAPPTRLGPLGLMQAFHFNRILLLSSKERLSADEARYVEKMSLGPLAKGDHVDTLMNSDPKFRPALSKNILRESWASQQSMILNSTVPVSIFFGSDDAIIRASYMQALDLPDLFDGYPVRFEGSGHAPFLDNQTVFEVLLSQFVGAVESGVAVGPAKSETDFALAS